MNTKVDNIHDVQAPTLRVAIVGGGIVGITTALGLLRRGIEVKIYEQASRFREIGAGVAFTTNAQKCMELLSPHVLSAMKAVSTKNDDPYYTYVDGYRRGRGQTDEPGDMNETQLFQLYAGDTGFDACHRAHFLDGLVSHLPDGVVDFEKRFDTFVRDEKNDQFVLHFQDGSTATADAVIGCDGIRSRVRQVLLGEDNPASYPGFTHQVAYRGLISMDRAVATLGPDKARNQCMHVGPGAHLLTFPVAQHTLMNVVAFGRQPGPWTHEKLVAPASRDELLATFQGWCPAVRAIAGLVEDASDGAGSKGLDKWAIFDTFDNPAPTYAGGGVCIAGDAAHATSPHHGAGAGAGIEDGLALATVLEKTLVILRRQQKGNGMRMPAEKDLTKGELVTAAFLAYDAVRRDRTQWLVRSSREVSETYEWANPACGTDPEKCLEDIKIRAHKIWYFDIDGMIRDAVSKMERYLAET